MHAEDKAAAAVAVIRDVLLSQNPKWESDHVVEEKRDGAWLVAQCELNLKPDCRHCCAGALVLLIAYVEAGYAELGERSPGGCVFWKRDNTVTLLNQVGYSKKQATDILNNVDEWLSSKEI